MMYACFTLQGDGETAAPGAFGITSSSVDRAYVGFAANVMMYPIVGLDADTSRPLFDHSVKVLELLKAEKTVWEAVDKANEDHMPETPTGADCPAIPKGDWNTTINRVYTGNTNIPGEKWYISFL
jgi:hypothetical protein